jgi:hypothetical protein
MDQVTYLAWAIGQSQYYRPCESVFACGMGRMGPADRLPKECAGRVKIWSANFLEREDEFVSP